MKRLINLFSSILWIVLLPLMVISQDQMMQNTRDALTRGMKVGQHTSTMLYGFDTRTTDVQGSFYLDTDWYVATVKFYPKTITTPKGTVRLDSLADIQIRVILKGNDVEFNTPEGIKVISGTLIKSFTAKKENQTSKNYINTLEFIDNYDKVKPSFFEILADGKIKLLEYYKVIVQKPDYVDAFNVGSKDIKIIKQTQLFITQGKEIIRFRSRKRQLFEAMTDKKTEIQKFIKENDLVIKDKNDLIKIFKYYNSITKEG